MGIVHSTIAPILYFKGLRYVSAGRAAVLGYLEPVIAIIFGIIFLSELPGKGSIIGGLLIIFSGYLTLRGENKQIFSGTFANFSASGSFKYSASFRYPSTTFAFFKIRHDAFYFIPK